MVTHDSVSEDLEGAERHECVFLGLFFLLHLLFG